MALSRKVYNERWRERNRREHRCSRCGQVRAAEDRQTDCCPVCREKDRLRAAKRYADFREKNPPDYARVPRQPFRLSKRLKNPRDVECRFDFDVLELFDACRRNWITSPDYEPRQVSEFIRRILALLQRGEHVVPCYGQLRKGDSAGLAVWFCCDEDNYAVLKGQQERTGCSLGAAARDCLRYGCKLLLAMPDKEARAYLWPRGNEPKLDTIAKPTEPEQKCHPYTVVRVDRYRKYDLGDRWRESEF